MMSLGRVLRWLPALVWMGTIFALSSTPTPAPQVVLARKFWFLTFSSAAHVAEYGILALLLVFALGRFSRAGAALAVALSLAYGVTDELHQSLVPGRVSTPSDVALDGLGAALAMGLCLSLAGVRRWLRPTRNSPRVEEPAVPL